MINCFSHVQDGLGVDTHDKPSSTITGHSYVDVMNICMCILFDHCSFVKPNTNNIILPKGSTVRLGVSLVTTLFALIVCLYDFLEPQMLD